MKYSLELQILVESIKVVLLSEPPQKLHTLVASNDINWQRFRKLVDFHSIRPIVFTAFKSINFQHEIMPYLESFQRNQAIRDLANKQSTQQILNIFQANGIKSLPYKGLLFKETLYKNTTLREQGDIDILVLPEDAVKAMQLLFSAGYVFSDYKYTDDKSLHSLVKNLASPEISLHQPISPLQANIDFHWGVNEFPLFQPNAQKIFDDATNQITNWQPDSIGIFAMLLNHHGSREFWVKLKHLADFIQYLKTYPNNYVLLENRAKRMKMERIFNCGIALLNEHFDFGEKVVLKHKETDILNKITNKWEEATAWNDLMPKLKMFELKKLMQDAETSWLKMIQLEYNIQAQYDKRIPPHFWFKDVKFFNFIAKFFVWASEKGLKKKAN